jgi:hypothetical protein
MRPELAVESTISRERVVTETLARIKGSNFYAGIYLVDDRVTEAAPIVGSLIFPLGRDRAKDEE